MDVAQLEAGGGGVGVVDVVPARGVVGPRARLPLQVVFRPAVERAYNVNVVVNVFNKVGRVQLNVKAESYEVKATLELREDRAPAAAAAAEGGASAGADTDTLTAPVITNGGMAGFNVTASADTLNIIIGEFAPPLTGLAPHLLPFTFKFVFIHYLNLRNIF